jgi:hypothetical protein
MPATTAYGAIGEKTSKRLTAILASEAFGFLLLLGLESAGAERAYSLGVKLNGPFLVLVKAGYFKVPPIG